tara:strand:+ start:142 stop:639 length:498 start_codon:yes stop_codon:yes gene_type:complete
MWVIIKFDKKKLTSLKDEFFKKLGSKPIFYSPKIKIQNYSKLKLNNKEVLLLGDYILCFHIRFSNKNIFNTLRYCKGVKYFLNGFSKAQLEIIEFIDRCKLNEDSQGFIQQSFFDFKNNKKFKFLSGPFTNNIFKIIEENKFYIKASIGKLNTKFSKEDYLFSPI